MGSSEYSMGLRSFLVSNDDPLSANRLRMIDRRSGQVEAKYLLEESVVSSPMFGIVQNGRANSSIVSKATVPVGTFDVRRDKVLDELETEPFTSRSAPAYANGNLRKGSVTSHRSNGSIKQRAAIVRSASRDNDEENASVVSDNAADNEVSETMDGSPYNSQKMRFIVPNKWEVLFYVANVQHLRIKKAGIELQVTPIS